MDKQTTAVTKTEPTSAEKFTSMVIREFSSLTGEVSLTPYKKRLAQHLFLKIDASLKSAEIKREQSGQTTKRPIVWANVNLEKVAIDAVHRVDLGLDALIPNHIHPIPYWNGKAGKYDLDLRIGFAGKDYYRRKVAVEEPLDIVYELIFSSDKFRPIKRGIKSEVEHYEFEIVQPFDRGTIIGGFGYIMFEDSRKNQLIIVTEADFQKSKNVAKSSVFWADYPVEMRHKTLVHRTTGKLSIDPLKINESYLAVEEEDNEDRIVAEISENANQEVIDVDVSVAEEVVEVVEEMVEEIAEESQGLPGF